MQPQWDFSTSLMCKNKLNTVLQKTQDSNGVDIRLGEELWETTSSPGYSKISFMKGKTNGAKQSVTRSDLTEVGKWLQINWIKSEHEY